MKVKKSLKEYVKVKIEFHKEDEFKIENLNYFLIENGLNSLEEIIEGSKKEYFLYLEKENFQESLLQFKKISKLVELSFKVTEAKIIDNSYLFEWKKYFKPIIIDEILIKPSWINLKIIEIDPKFAFGSGAHPTTRGCIEFISKLKFQSFLDAGCGTGILSIVAEKCGANKVLSFDIDFDAVKIAKENFEKNRCKKIIYFCGSFSAIKNSKKFDVVCANLLLSTIIENKKFIVELTKDNGFIILSGIEKSENEKFYELFLDESLKIIDKKIIENWRTYLITKISS